MAYNKIIDSSGMVHATQPRWSDRDTVRTMCAYDVPTNTTSESTERLTCGRCGVAIHLLHEEADKLNKAISFGWREALFDTRVARTGGTPTPWAKLKLGDVEDLWERAGEIFNRAVADDLPAEAVIRAAYRFESLRLEIAYMDAQRAKRRR